MDSQPPTKPPKLPLSRLQLAAQERRTEQSHPSPASTSSPHAGRARSASAPSEYQHSELAATPPRSPVPKPHSDDADLVLSPPEAIGSPDTIAARTTIERGRGVPEIDNLLARLNYPRTVVKVVAEYQPKTMHQLLCELKKEEVRTKWALTPMGKRRPIEALEQHLRNIDRNHGFETHNAVLEDIDELLSRRKLLRKIDKANAKRALNETD